MTHSASGIASPFPKAWQFKMRLRKPKSIHGFGFGFAFRFVVGALAVVIPLVPVVFMGAINSWVVTPSIVTIYAVVCGMIILLGEHLRVRVFERIRLVEAPEVEVEFNSSRAPSIRGYTEQTLTRRSAYQRSALSALTTSYAKRLLDVSVATIGLVLLLPLFAVVASLIWFTMGRPIFFLQRKRGLCGRNFLVYRFRTMSLAEDGATIPAGDPRVTLAGKWLRSTSIDTLPELINVARGEMTLVGPPAASPFDEKDDAAVDLALKPGLINPGDPIQYAEGWSISRDIRMMVKSTIYVMLGRRHEMP